MLDVITPNFAILRNPHNWFFVAFCLALFAIILHIFFGDKANG